MANEAEPVVTATNISKRYILRNHGGNPLRRTLRYLVKGPRPGREHWALHDLNFEIRRGESVALMGVNGSGKSTLLRVIAGVTRPTGGAIRVAGAAGGLVDLGAGFHSDLTGFENIFLHGTLLGLSRAQIRARLKGIEDFCELGQHLNSPVRQYSWGMFLRLGFAIAIHTDPEIFIVDEALAVGDGYFQWKCLRKIEELKKQGTTLLFVSHLPDMAEMVCERAMWIHEGRIVEDGISTEVVQKYNQFLFQGILEEEPSHLSLKLNALLPYSRCGNGQVIIRDVKLLDGEGRIQRSFLSRSRMQIRFTAVAKQSVPAASVYVIHERPGQSVSFVDSWQQGKPYVLAEGENVITVTYPDLRLRQGNYNLSLAIGPAGDHSVLYDCHQKIYSFTVVEPVARLEIARDRMIDLDARVEWERATT